jgi:hypothetical protein
MRLPRLVLLLAFTVPLGAACSGPSLGAQSCSQLMDAYTAALPAALACDPGAANQCQQQAMSASSCSCEATVQDATELNAIVTELRAQGCIPTSTVACPCVAPLPLTCIATDGGGGICSAAPHTTG